MRRHVYYYELLDVPHDEASEVFLGDPSEWLPSPATADGDSWLVDLRADGALPAALSTRRARVRLGPAAEVPPASAGRTPNQLLRVLGWKAATGGDVFPTLSADLELAALQGAGSQLSLRGSYRPPLSVVGDAADAVLGHRVAEACVRRFVLDVARGLARRSTIRPA